MNYFAPLYQNLETLQSFYVELEASLWEEHRGLISAEGERIEQANVSKEMLLQKITLAEKNREALVLQIGQQLGKPNASLKEIAEMAGDLRPQLLKKRDDLRTLIARVQDINAQNREYAENALKVLGGALTNIKDTLSGKKTYQKKGKLGKGPEQAGHFVSREA
ncbi:MAG: flagellar protein FlgN [Bdellovibrionota bacterium]